MHQFDATNATIAESWIAHYRRHDRSAADRELMLGADLDHTDDPDWWAIDRLLLMEFENPARVLDIAFLIARTSDDDWILENLGAGPIESLLAGDPTFLDPITVEVQSSPNLRTALTSVWQNRMPDPVWEAVQHLARAGPTRGDNIS